MRKKLFVILVLTIQPLNSAGAIVIRHDVEGKSYLAVEADYPGVFNLITTPRGYRDCPVTLISDQWGITAAHCAEAPRLANAINEGKVFPVKVDGQENGIVEVEFHPTWHGRPDPESFDLALVRLARPVSGDTSYPLYTGDDELGKTVIMVGWGGTGTGLTGVSGEDAKFRKAENIVDEVFMTALSWDFSEPNAGDARPSPLEGVSGPGDSGGPAFIKTPEGLALAGISSGQDNREQPPGSYGVREYYARISSAVEWVRSVIGK